MAGTNLHEYGTLLPVADRRYSFQAAWKLLRSPIRSFLPRITRPHRVMPLNNDQDGVRRFAGKCLYLSGMYRANQ